MEETQLYAGVLPTLEMYESIDRLQKPVIASVNGYAVGGGNVLQMVCDVTIAADNAMFRQVGPMVGSFDAGYGTWYLEDLIGKKRAKLKEHSHATTGCHQFIAVHFANVMALE